MIGALTILAMAAAAEPDAEPLAKKAAFTFNCEAEDAGSGEPFLLEVFMTPSIEVQGAMPVRFRMTPDSSDSDVIVPGILLKQANRAVDDSWVSPFVMTLRNDDAVPAPVERFDMAFSIHVAEGSDGKPVATVSDATGEGVFSSADGVSQNMICVPRNRTIS